MSDKQTKGGAAAAAANSGAAAGGKKGEENKKEEEKKAAEEELVSQYCLKSVICIFNLVDFHYTNRMRKINR